MVTSYTSKVDILSNRVFKAEGALTDQSMHQKLLDNINDSVQFDARVITNLMLTYQKSKTRLENATVTTLIKNTYTTKSTGTNTNPIFANYGNQQGDMRDSKKKKLREDKMREDKGR